MRNTIRRLVVPGIALAAAACGGSQSHESAVSGDLRRDLELASSAGVQLAPSARAATIVSAIERVPAATRSSAPRPKTTRPRPHDTPAPREVAVTDPAASGNVSDAVQPASEADVASASPVSNGQSVVIGEGDHGAGDSGVGTVGDVGRGAGGSDVGTVLGGIMGVVLRGGGVGDDDHCEREPGGGRRFPAGGVLGPSGGTIIGRRMPAGAGRPTYYGPAGARWGTR